MTLPIDARAERSADALGDAPQLAARGGWRVYLAAIACLAPIVTPAGPGQTAIVDFANLVALAVFGFMVLRPGAPVRLPLIGPAIVIAAGSLLAMMNAVSMSAATLAIVQDVYLYAWFIMLVNLIRDARDLRAIRIAWLWTANAVALWGVAQVFLHGGASIPSMFGPRGFRPASTLGNCNVFADYVVMSIFVLMSLGNEVPRWVRWGSFAILGMGLIVTKSNGGMTALMMGTAAWILVRAATRRIPVIKVAAVAALVGGVVAFGAWMNLEWGVGKEQLAGLERYTFMSRMSHSSESRKHIWEQLQRSYARSPLGIGPGNSRTIQLSIEERERPGSYLSKEAHNDYLGYFIERGPIGLVGLLFMIGVVLAQVAGFWRHASRLEGNADAAGRWSAAMVGAIVASSTHSMVIEKLHFRHFWVLVAMIFGAAWLAERAAAAASGRHRSGPAEATPADSAGLAALSAARRRLALHTARPGW
jgi:O-antigen ligase